MAKNASNTVENNGEVLVAPRETQENQDSVIGSQLTENQTEALASAEPVVASAAAEPAKEREYLFPDLASVQASFAGRSANASVGGEVAVIQSRFARNEMSMKVRDEALAWLKSIAAPGSNLGPSNELADEILASIKRNYHPAHSLEEAKKEGAEIVRLKIKQDAEFEGTQVSRFVISLADIGSYLIAGGELIVSTREVPQKREDGTSGKARYCKMHADLWSKIKEQQMFGDVETITTEKNGKKRVEKVFDPYNDRSIAPMVKLGTMKACLLAHGAKTEVRFGYVHKKNTTTGRVSRSMVVEPTAPEGKEKDYYKIVAVPYNVLQPKFYAPVEKERQVTVVSATGTERKTVKYTVMMPVEDNEDTSLRWLPDEAVEPLYQHHFADHTLIYDLEARGDKKLPSCSIIGSHDPHFPPMQRQRETTTGDSSEIGKLSEALSKEKSANVHLQAELQKAQAGISNDDILRSLQASSGRIRNHKIETSVAVLATALDVSLAVLERFEHSRQIPPDDVLRQLWRVHNSTDMVIEHDEDSGKSYYIGDGGLRREIPIGNGTRKAA